MKPDTVYKTITNSDGSCNTLAANSTESRDEDDESHAYHKPDLRDEASALMAAKRAILHKRSEQSQPLHESETLLAYLEKGGNTPVTTLLPSPTVSFETTPLRNRDDSLKRDDASTFSLFGYSFDSVSPTTELEDTFPSSPVPRNGRHEIDISLPALTHVEENDDNDISPIKIDLGHDHRGVIDPTLFRYHHEIRDHHQHWQGYLPPPTPPRPYGYDEYRNYDSHAYSNPVYVLRSCRDAFRECTFILSHVQTPNPLAVNCSSVGSFYHHHNTGNLESEFYDPRDLVIACRRVKAAICAFGGSTLMTSPRNRDSIFRGFDGWDQQYESRLHRRYHLNGSQISWDSEEHPPIYIDSGEGLQQQPSEADAIQLSPDGSTAQDDTATDTPSPESECGDDQRKMRYRCKLCGQPKQNHSCPYRQAMQRSIGVSVYPAVNAYTACEPGCLAPALSDMNNFVDRSEEGFLFEAVQANNHSPHAPEMTPPYTGSVVSENRNKRKYSEVNEHKPVIRQVSPFVQTESLYREQYRAVSSLPKNDDFQYPPLPLSFQERKKLSDTLFALSKEIHNLRDEVASILHEARERNLWDMAVAQVMTQVIVALYCGEGDKRLDGLHHYLLGIGISS